MVLEMGQEFLRRLERNVESWKTGAKAYINELVEQSQRQSEEIPNC